MTENPEDENIAIAESSSPDTDGYGTFHEIPKTLTLTQRRVIRSSKKLQLKTNESRLNRTHQVFTKFSKVIQSLMKKAKEIQRNYLRIWGSSIKQIEGQLGSGVSTYFKVIVWLLKINVLCMLLGLALIVGPGGYMANKQHDHDKDTKYNKDDLTCTDPNFFNGTSSRVKNVNSVIQFFTGTGWLERTAMFYGWYPTMNITKNDNGKEETTYFFSLAYFTVGISYFLLSLLYMLYNLSKQFTKSAAEQLKSMPYSSQVFLWDYGLDDVYSTERICQAKIQALKEKITEDEHEDQKRDFRTKFGIFFLRIFTNVLCLGAMAGAAFLYVNEVMINRNDTKANKTDSCGKIHYEGAGAHAHLSKFWRTYSTSIIVAGSNVILPIFFEIVGYFEKYKVQSTRIGITLLRIFVFKVFNISTYVYTLYLAVGPSGGEKESWQTQENTLYYNCWEDYMASQFYQLVIIDFIVFCGVLLLTEVLPSCLVTRISFFRDRFGLTKPEFDIPASIQDLVHKQMILWSGFFFAPLFPVIAVVEVVAIFYLKKISALSSVVPPKKVILNYQSTFTVNCLFLISLLFVFVFMGLVIFTLEPSTTCGPFIGTKRFSDPFVSVIDQSGAFKKYFVDSIEKTSVFIILVIVVVLVMYYYRSLAVSRKVTIELLRQQVNDEIAVKKFLVERVQQPESSDSKAKRASTGRKVPPKLDKEKPRNIYRMHSFAS